VSRRPQELRGPDASARPAAQQHPEQSVVRVVDYRVVELSVHGCDYVNLLTTIVRTDRAHFQHDVWTLAWLLIPDRPGGTGEERQMLVTSAARGAIVFALEGLFNTGKPRTFARLTEYVDATLDLALSRGPHTAELAGEIMDHLTGSLSWIYAAGTAPFVTAETSTFDFAHVPAGKLDVRVTFSDSERERFAPWLRMLARTPDILARRTTPLSQAQVMALAVKWRAALRRARGHA
jgi:hypothetical protein